MSRSCVRLCNDTLQSTKVTGRCTAVRRSFTSTCRKQSPDWSSSLYLKFEDHRTMPVRDLLAKVPLQQPRKIVDLGCGPGNSTAVLAERFPESQIEGMDSSPDMLAKARRTLPNVNFFQADLEEYTPDPAAELLFSNATFHWLPEDRRVPIMQQLLGGLRSGGVLAIQMPDNFNEPSHAGMREVARMDGPWAEKLHGKTLSVAPLPTPTKIYNELNDLCSHLEIWHIRYNHVLADHSSVVEWVKSTGLRPFINPLNETQRTAFLERYLRHIEASYASLKDGRVTFAFPRLFLVATRK